MSESNDLTIEALSEEVKESEMYTKEQRAEIALRTSKELKSGLGVKVLRYKELKQKVDALRQKKVDQGGRPSEELYNVDARMKILRDEIDREIESKKLRAGTVWAWTGKTE